MATLPVKGRAPLTGYSRDQFGPAWPPINGCDARNRVLHRDLTNVVTESGTDGCIVTSGVLHDPYTATVIHFTRGPGTSTVVQIDHVVALANAWQTGAQQLTMAVRIQFANDPLELLAVSGVANEQKGDGDAATWLPPNKPFRCRYVAIQVAVKMKYHLWVTAPEHDAIARVLSACPTQPLPTSGGAGASSPPAVQPPAAPPTTLVPAPTTTAPGGPIVHPGAFCSPPGTRGVTKAGTPMICKLDSARQHYRWGAA